LFEKRMLSGRDSDWPDIPLTLTLSHGGERGKEEERGKREMWRY